MAVIEICDICKKQIHTSDGIIIKYSDMAGFGFNENDRPIRKERNHEARICNNCISKIKNVAEKNQYFNELNINIAMLREKGMTQI